MAAAGNQEIDWLSYQAGGPKWPYEMSPNRLLYPELAIADLRVLADLPEDWNNQERKYSFEDQGVYFDELMVTAISILRNHAAGRRVCDADDELMPTNELTVFRNEVLRAPVSELNELWPSFISEWIEPAFEKRPTLDPYPHVFEVWDDAARGLSSFSFHTKRLYECACLRQDSQIVCNTHLPVMEHLQSWFYDSRTVTAACEAFFKEHRDVCLLCDRLMRFRTIVLDRLPPFLMVHCPEPKNNDEDIQKHIDALQPFEYRDAQNQPKMCHYTRISAYIVSNNDRTVPVFAAEGEYWMKDMYEGYPRFHTNADLRQLLLKHAGKNKPFAIVGILLADRKI